MKTIIYLLLVVVLSSCDNKRKLEREKFVADSLRTEFVKDSIATAIKNDSLVLIAWGDTKFGMSKKECLKTYSFSEAYKYESSLGMSYDKRYDFKKAFNIETSIDIDALFRGEGYDELTFIEIRSLNVYANDFDELVKDCARFSIQFEKNYGEPLTYNYVSFSDMNNGYEKNFSSWRIESPNNGTKSIGIYIGEVSSGSEYYYRILIHNDAFPKNAYKPTKEEIEQEKKEKERRDNIIKNSF